MMRDERQVLLMGWSPVSLSCLVLSRPVSCPYSIIVYNAMRCRSFLSFIFISSLRVPDRCVWTTPLVSRARVRDTRSNGATHVWFSPLGDRNHAPTHMAATMTRPMKMLYLYHVSCGVSDDTIGIFFTPLAFPSLDPTEGEWDG
ncbi:hypothetical protein F5Y03DRAFT_94685 [Xylaria venustula]|nr:hypothetical protein F5Y03DRAFT_94685 [Xylaria venustula]